MADTDNGNPTSAEHSYAVEEHPTTDALIVQHKSGGKGRKILFALVGVFLVLLLIAGVVLLVALLLIVGRQPPRVHTTCGTYEGTYHLPAEVFSFKGIPFAQPPVGKLRWQPTQEHNASTCPEMVVDAKKDASQCVQWDNHTKETTGSEDCLYLNIFTPDIDKSAGLPVMVYIHGGYLMFGNASMPGYCPSEDTAKLLGVVVVSIQYRLNAFGFMVNDALPGTGNYGLMDQIQALKWLQENILNFGGDPSQVTLFGQSSGGTSVFALMTSPKAKGLFHRAWMISGSPVFDTKLEDARKLNSFFLNKTGCSTEECQMGLTPEDVLKAVYPEWDDYYNSLDLPTKGYFAYPIPVVDGNLFPKSPLEMWAGKEAGISDVPFIVGTTAQELDMDPMPGWHAKNQPPPLKHWSRQMTEDYIREYLDPFGPQISNRSLELYGWDHDAEYPAEYLFTSMASDIRVNCGNDVVAEKAAAALSHGVYRYVITSFPSSPAHLLGGPFPAVYAFHAWDIFAFFDSYEDVLTGDTENSDKEFGDLLRRNIMHFVKKGVPADAEWRQMPNCTALISDKLEVVDQYNKEQCDFWLENDFYRYSWWN